MALRSSYDGRIHRLQSVRAPGKLRRGVRGEANTLQRERVPARNFYCLALFAMPVTALQRGSQSRSLLSALSDPYAPTGRRNSPCLSKPVALYTEVRHGTEREDPRLRLWPWGVCRIPAPIRLRRHRI